MWYISSPEKSVVPWSSGNGVYPSLAVSDGGDNVMVEPGPAIFYLTNPSNSDGEDILIGSAPLGVPTAYGNGIQPSFILPDAETPSDLIRENATEGVISEEEIPIDLPISLDELKLLSAQMEVSIPVDETHLEVEREFLDQTGGSIKKKKKKKKKPNDLDNTNASQTTFQAPPNQYSSPVVSSQKVVVCSRCQVEINGGCEAVINHILERHADRLSKVFPCVMCTAQFTTESSTRKHVRNVHYRMESFECPVCRKTVQQRSHLKTHINDIHGGKKALKAVLDKAKEFIKANPGFYKKALACAEQVPSYAAAKGGILTASNNSSSSQQGGDIMALNEVMKCSQCMILITSKLHFVLHIKEVHGGKTLAPLPPSSPQGPLINGHTTKAPLQVSSEEKDTAVPSSPLKAEYSRTIKCEICSKVCQSAAHFNAHRTHFHPLPSSAASPMAPGPIKCSQCSFVCSHTGQLLMHVTQSHPYQCSECPRHYSLAEELRDHYLKDHGTARDEKVSCPSCGKSFTRKWDMKRHHRIYHEAENDTQMDQARSPLGTQHHQPPPPPSLESGGETVDVESVSADVSSVSVDQSPLPMALPSHLDIEDDKQMDSTVLRQIMNIVVSLQPNQDKRFPCDYCRAMDTFKTRKELLGHILNEHPFRCPLCPNLKLVKLVRSMQKHVRTLHPYSQSGPAFCKTCTAVFKDNQELRRHLKASHPDQLSGLADTPTKQALTPSRQNVVTPPSKKATPKTAEGETENTSGVQAFCVVCKADYPSIKELVDHVEEAHPYECEVCGREYKLADSIRKHCRKEHSDYFKEPPTACRFCPSVFHSVAEKQEHILNVHNIKVNGHKYMAEAEMSLNNSNFVNTTIDSEVETLNLTNGESGEGHRGVSSNPRINALKRKLSTDSDDSSALSTPPPAAKLANTTDLIYSCPVPKCDKEYNVSASLRKHCFRTHDGLAIQICKSCPMTFKKMAQWEKHAKTCQGVPLQPPNVSSAFSTHSPVVRSPRAQMCTPLKQSTPKQSNSSAESTPVRIPISKQASIKSFITPPLSNGSPPCRPSLLSPRKKGLPIRK